MRSIIKSDFCKEEIALKELNSMQSNQPLGSAFASVWASSAAVALASLPQQDFADASASLASTCCVTDLVEQQSFDFAREASDFISQLAASDEQVSILTSETESFVLVEQQSAPTLARVACSIAGQLAPPRDAFFNSAIVGTATDSALSFASMVTALGSALEWVAFATSAFDAPWSQLKQPDAAASAFAALGVAASDLSPALRKKGAEARSPRRAPMMIAFLDRLI